MPWWSSTRCEGPLKGPYVRGGLLAALVIAAALVCVAVLETRGAKRSIKGPTDVELLTARLSVARYCTAKNVGRPPPISREEMRRAAELVLSAADDSPTATIGDQRRRDLLADTAESFSSRCEPELGARLGRAARSLKGS